MDEIRGLSFEAETDERGNADGIRLNARLGLELHLIRIDDSIGIGISDGEEVRGVAYAPEQIDAIVTQLQQLRDRAAAAAKRRLQ